MPRFHVYQTEPNGDYKTIDTTSARDASDVDKLIGQKEQVTPGTINWFGASSNATTPEAAISEAIAGGYKYVSPADMARLHADVGLASVRASHALQKRGLG